MCIDVFMITAIQYISDINCVGLPKSLYYQFVYKNGNWQYGKMLMINIFTFKWQQCWKDESTRKVIKNVFGI